LKITLKRCKVSKSVQSIVLEAGKGGERRISQAVNPDEAVETLSWVFQSKRRMYARGTKLLHK
jgi:hypothetical protein